MNDHDFCRIDYKMVRDAYPAPKFKGRVYKASPIHPNQQLWCEVFFVGGSVYRDFACCAWKAKADALDWINKTPSEK
jgi:hypothetical protein